MNTNQAVPKNKYNIWIWIVSIAIPVVVAILFTIRIPGVERMGFLPPIYASVNALTALVLIMALFQIKKGNRKNTRAFYETCHRSLCFIFTDVCSLSHEFRLHKVWRHKWRWTALRCRVKRYRCYKIRVLLHFIFSYFIVCNGNPFCVGYLR